jgi:hypothetical protein
MRSKRERVVAFSHAKQGVAVSPSPAPPPEGGGNPIFVINVYHFMFSAEF